jgi:hypothetical protein
MVLLGGLGVMLPSPPSDPTAMAGVDDDATLSAMEMLSSATSAFSDVASFCVRQPGACETAAYVAAQLKAKAKYNVKLVYEWATEDERPSALIEVPAMAEPADPLSTGSSPAATKISRRIASQSTLRLDDLIPSWRGPVAGGHEG